MLGMTGNKVESVKIIGTRGINMDANLKAIFNNEDDFYIKPYFNDAQFNWETFNTRKIKTVFFSPGKFLPWEHNDYGTKIRIKCYRAMNRIDRTSDGERCANWQDVDSYGIRLDQSNSSDTVYRNFYDPMYSNLGKFDDPSTSGRAYKLDHVKTIVGWH